MTTFIEQLNSIPFPPYPLFLNIRKKACDFLPKDKVERDKIYQEMQRGTAVLETEDTLNMYLNSYGKMHREKLNEAFRYLSTDFFKNEVEIYDWGCGQGIATICLLDYLNYKKFSYNLHTIHLIEPSKLAGERAENIIRCFYPKIKVNRLQKTLDELSSKDFEKTNTTKIHLFSNILDVTSFDLSLFIHFFQQTFSGKNYFYCVGPYYANNKRVDDFVAAAAPDEMYGVINAQKGEWKNDWTMALRVFYKNFKQVERLEDIRKRIEDFHKKEQFFAGYVLDAVAETYQKAPFAQEAESLYHSLSAFEVKSNIALGNHKEYNSVLAVLANIISRGLPTKAPLLLENYFANFFGIATKPEEGKALRYTSTHKLTAEQIFEALHIIDPRFEMKYYNADTLAMNYNKAFVEQYLIGTNREYLAQLLEPQRKLSSIVRLPYENFVKDQAVDFVFELPYQSDTKGVVINCNGLLCQSLWRNDLKASFQQIGVTDFISEWQKNSPLSNYLSIAQKNYYKSLTGDWAETLQIVLSPIAMARVERMLIEAMMSNVLNLSTEEWNILVIERDIPCAAIAIENFKETYAHLIALAEIDQPLPKINLSIISTEAFKDSPLHLKEGISTTPSNDTFDLCLDVSVLLRDNIEALPLTVDAKTVFIIRSSHYKKHERQICTAESIVYPPLVAKDSMGKYESIPEREAHLIYFLQNIFRKPAFRMGQLPILSHTLGNKTTIGLLPTGGGKSLTYQLSCILQPGVSVVVAPLVSLMIDQVRSMRDIRIDACDCVNSGMTGAEKSEKLNLLQNGAVLFMILSPERFMIESFREALLTMTEKNYLHFTYGVIDEVHCVSEWGHDFRTAYLHLGRNMMEYMRTKSGVKLPIIGLTATASFDVLADVERELTLGGKLEIDSETIVRPESDSRPELTYRVIEVKADFDSLKIGYRIPDTRENDKSTSRIRKKVAEAKKRYLQELIKEVPFDIDKNNQLGENKECYIKDFNPDVFFDPIEKTYANAGIIFCPHRTGNLGVKENNGVSSSLINNRLLKIGTFIGGDKPEADMKTFIDNQQNIMVATKAFGMGIDKPNIRFTVNFNHPSSIESFVQEGGRAGRDKKHAISYILYEPTEYIHFSADKIENIKSKIENTGYLEKYRGSSVLINDFHCIGKSEGKTETEINALLQFIREQKYIENADKEVVMWFHNNSFKGVDKEKEILLEMTDNILNVKPTVLKEIQAKLRDALDDEDLYLKIDSKKNALTVCSQEEKSKQYGYIFLDTLRFTYQYANFEIPLCQKVVNELISILKTYEKHQAEDLNKVIEEKDVAQIGIYQAMEKAEKGGYVYVTISWENSINQNKNELLTNIKQQIEQIALRKGWKNVKNDFNLESVDNYDSLITRIADSSNDPNWERYSNDDACRKLQRIFLQKREKADTDKAIYRMCCIGLVEDVTVDYSTETYELKVRNRTDEEFRQCMLDFFRKYYSLERAKEKMTEIDNAKGRNYLDKCLGYLTDFIYANLEKKRYRAIEDMRIACEDSISERNKTGNDDWLKEFIHLYFNSKYARKGYTVDGENYSLSEDTDEQGREDFAVVNKYIKIIEKDSSGTEVDNVKHLYGATRLTLRAHPDNAALQLLLCYCICFLGAGTNQTLKNNAISGYIEGFMKLYELEKERVWQHINAFNNYIDNKIRDEELREQLVHKGRANLTLLIHEKELEQITQKYINKD
ncbi:DEAD/DEAH box helicase [Capnocytophaga bilenii]